MRETDRERVIRMLAEQRSTVNARISEIVTDQVNQCIDSMELQMMGIKP